MVNKHIPYLIILLLGFGYSCEKASSTPEEFEIESDFELKLVASEPLIFDPVELKFNEKGEAFVLEMPGYPFGEDESRLIKLLDTDKNGKYDERIVFAENLRLASSFLPYKNGFLVAAPPFLLQIRDTNEDLKADKVDTLMGGFTNGNLQHNYNGLTLGLDGWIYSANGGNSGKPFWWDDKESQLDLKGDDFRFSIESMKMERIGESSGGYGIGMDEWGNIFGTHNLEHISSIVFSSSYIGDEKILIDHTLKNISDHEENGLARIYPIGEQETRVNHPEQSGYFSGSCGIHYYGGGQLGKEYEKTIWVADVVLNLIHVDRISSKGSNFSASRVIEKKDFLTSSDRSFRPVNITTGPDGNIYVVDMYREVIEHPEWIPDEIESGLDLNSGKDLGRIYKIQTKGTRNSFESQSLETFQNQLQELKSENQWMRMQAHRILIQNEISDKNIEEVIGLLNDGNDLARLHAMYILSVKDKLDVFHLSDLLIDENPTIREKAAIILEGLINTNPEIVEKLIINIQDANLRVSMQSLLSLSTLDPDVYDLKKELIVEKLVGRARSTNDVYYVAAFTLASKYAMVEIFKLLAERNEKDYEPLLESLSYNMSSKPKEIEALLEILPGLGLDNSLLTKIINQISDGEEFEIKNGETHISKIESQEDLDLIKACSRLRSKLKLPESVAYLEAAKKSLNILSNKANSNSSRIHAAEYMEFLPFQDKKAILLSCLNNTESTELQEIALGQILNSNDSSTGYDLVTYWKNLSPGIRKIASDALVWTEDYHDALLTGLEDGTINIGEMNFDLERRRSLLWWNNSETTKRRAEKLFSDSGVTTRKEAIEKMKLALNLEGKIENGSEIFETHCSSCHKFKGEGKEVGPNLTEISRKSKATILHEIIDPNAAVDSKYISHRIQDKNGKNHIGIVASETANEVVLINSNGLSQSIQKSDISLFESLGSSLMTEGFENNISHQEMADLLEYLQLNN